MGLSLTEIKNLTDNEFIMIMATKISIKEKESEQMASNRAKPAMRPPTPKGGLY